jgi:hypothetical protein
LRWTTAVFGGRSVAFDVGVASASSANVSLAGDEGSGLNEPCEEEEEEVELPERPRKRSIEAEAKEGKAAEREVEAREERRAVFERASWVRVSVSDLARIFRGARRWAGSDRSERRRRCAPERPTPSSTASISLSHLPPRA